MNKMKLSILLLIVSSLYILIASCANDMNQNSLAVDPITNSPTFEPSALQLETPSPSSISPDPIQETITDKNGSVDIIFPIDRIQNSDDVSAYIDDIIDSMGNLPSDTIAPMRLAINALLKNNPIYAPDDVAQMLLNSFKGIVVDENSYAFYSYIDGRLYINSDLFDSEADLQSLKFALTHELCHSLSVSKKESKSCFDYSTNEKIQGLDWGNRMTEGLTDLYAFSAIGSELSFVEFGEYGNIKSLHYLNSPYVYPNEQMVAIMLCNAFGRRIVAEAYFGTDENYLNLGEYYTELTGDSFDDLLGLAERFVAYSYTFGDKPLVQDEASAAGKEYMMALLTVLKNRLTQTDSDVFREELSAYIQYLPDIHDSEFMHKYYILLNNLLESLAE